MGCTLCSNNNMNMEEYRIWQCIQEHLDLRYSPGRQKHTKSPACGISQQRRLRLSLFGRRY